MEAVPARNALAAASASTRSLALAAAGGAIRPVHLDHVVGSIEEHTAELGPVGTSALHGEHRPDAVLLGPGHQLLVALAGGRKGELAEPSSIRSKSNRNVEVAVCMYDDDMIELGRLPMSWQGC